MGYPSRFKVGSQEGSSGSAGFLGRFGPWHHAGAPLACSIHGWVEVSTGPPQCPPCHHQPGGVLHGELGGRQALLSFLGLLFFFSFSFLWRLNCPTVYHLIGPPLYHVCVCKEIWISLHSGALLELIAHHSCHCHFLYKKSIKTVAGLTAWSSEWPAGCDSGRGWSGVVNSQLMREIWAEILCLSTFRSRLYYPISIHAENLPQS